MKLQEPSQTSLRVALSRAIESRLPEPRRICSDPFAHYFLDERMRKIYDSWLRRRLFYLRSDIGFPCVVGAVVARTRYLDDYLKRCMATGIEQIVILGAGYDTRALRLDVSNSPVSTCCSPVRGWP